MTVALPPALDSLVERLGITRAFWDASGTFREVPEATHRKLLVAMGVLSSSDADEASVASALEREIAAEKKQCLPLVRVLREGEPGVLPISVDGANDRTRLMTLILESGERKTEEVSIADLPVLEDDDDGGAGDASGDASGDGARDGAGYPRHRVDLPLPPLPSGYHALEIDGLGRTALIVAPDRCYEGRDDATGRSDKRVWGLALQLYAVRSEKNWGIGDFGDLRRAADVAAELGADVIGVNPLHALFPHDPEAASPYSPSSRVYLNPLAIDIGTVERWLVGGPSDGPSDGPGDGSGAGPGRGTVEDRDARLAMLRACDTIDYSGVAALKSEALEGLWQTFIENHHAKGTAQARAFDAFSRKEGAALERFALFEALREARFAAGELASDWRQWPAALRSPESAAVHEFATANEQRIAFHRWLQWLAAEQLEAASRGAVSAGLAVGLYRDLAVGIAAGGADAWADQALYASGVHVGAPPDEFSANGQDWGLPPLDPRALRAAAYAPLAAMLRANMRAAGAIRIDHVMGLARLYWIPAGDSPASGTYVNYPLDELLAVVALESQRARCIVIGEDLGTVPDGFRERLADAGVLSYKLLYFEKHYDSDQRFRQPAEYPAQSLVGADTHDLPTLRGFWQGTDLALRDELGLFPSADMHAVQLAARADDRHRLLQALHFAGLLPDGIDVDAPDPARDAPMSDALVAAVHRYLARTPSRLLLANIEDLLGQIEQMNLPGTDRDVYPNWRRKLPVDLESWCDIAAVRTAANAMTEERVARSTG